MSSVPVTTEFSTFYNRIQPSKCVSLVPEHVRLNTRKNNADPTSESSILANPFRVYNLTLTFQEVVLSMLICVIHFFE